MLHASKSEIKDRTLSQTNERLKREAQAYLSSLGISSSAFEEDVFDSSGTDGDAPDAPSSAANNNVGDNDGGNGVAKKAQNIEAADSTNANNMESKTKISSGMASGPIDKNGSDKSDNTEKRPQRLNPAVVSMKTPPPLPTRPILHTSKDAKPPEVAPEKITKAKKSKPPKPPKTKYTRSKSLKKSSKKARAKRKKLKNMRETFDCSIIFEEEEKEEEEEDDENVEEADLEEIEEEAEKSENMADYNVAGAGAGANASGDQLEEKGIQDIEDEGEHHEQQRDFEKEQKPQQFPKYEQHQQQKQQLPKYEQHERRKWGNDERVDDEDNDDEEENKQNFSRHEPGNLPKIREYDFIPSDESDSDMFEQSSDNESDTKSFNEAKNQYEYYNDVSYAARSNSIYSVDDDSLVKMAKRLDDASIISDPSIICGPDEELLALPPSNTSSASTEQKPTRRPPHPKNSSPMMRNKQPNRPSQQQRRQPRRTPSQQQQQHRDNLRNMTQNKKAPTQPMDKKKEKPNNHPVQNPQHNAMQQAQKSHPIRRTHSQPTQKQHNQPMQHAQNLAASNQHGNINRAANSPIITQSKKLHPHELPSNLQKPSNSNGGPDAKPSDSSAGSSSESYSSDSSSSGTSSGSSASTGSSDSSHSYSSSDEEHSDGDSAHSNHGAGSDEDSSQFSTSAQYQPSYQDDGRARPTESNANLNPKPVRRNFAVPPVAMQTFPEKSVPSSHVNNRMNRANENYHPAGNRYNFEAHTQKSNFAKGPSTFVESHIRTNVQDPLESLGPKNIPTQMNRNLTPKQFTQRTSMDGHRPRPGKRAPRQNRIWVVSDSPNDSPPVVQSLISPQESEVTHVPSRNINAPHIGQQNDQTLEGVSARVRISQWKDSSDEEDEESNRNKFSMQGFGFNTKLSSDKSKRPSFQHNKEHHTSTDARLLNRRERNANGGNRKPRTRSTPPAINRNKQGPQQRLPSAKRSSVQSFTAPADDDAESAYDSDCNTEFFYESMDEDDSDEELPAVGTSVAKAVEDLNNQRTVTKMKNLFGIRS